MAKRRATMDAGRLCKTPFRYPGSKASPKVRRWILSHAPASWREYREPFVGGGGVFFAISPRVVRWVNDADESLVSVYLALRDRPAEFLASCRAIPHAGHDLLAEKFAELADVAPRNCADEALRYLFLNRTGFLSGRVRGGRLHFSNPKGWAIVHSAVMERAAARLAGVRITSGDAGPLLEAPGEGVWVYCDPPYFRDTELDGTAGLYEHRFAAEDHARLAARVLSSPHKVCVSYDDHPEVRRLYAGLRFVSRSWNYKGVSVRRCRAGQELLVLNYDPPAASLFG